MNRSGVIYRAIFFRININPRHKSRRYESRPEHDGLLLFQRLLININGICDDGCLRYPGMAGE